MSTDSEWFAEHSAYLATPEWRRKRDAVLTRDGGRCQAGMPICDGVATQVHHLTYKHWRNEPLFDLIAVCASCHGEITQMDREQQPHRSRIGARPDVVIDLPDEYQSDVSRRLRGMLIEGA